MLLPVTNDRTIPTGAGPTTSSRATSSSSADHPRRRGADRPSPFRHSPQGGPSPQARGRRGVDGALGLAQRTIPAGAGPTGRPGRPPPCTTDHPRRRGVDYSGKDYGGKTSGPSPQARGRRRPTPIMGIRCRTIPAGAGPTAQRRPSRQSPPDHPRRRGADGTANASVRLITGPSPQARGRRHGATPAWPPPGTIPADAGPTGRRGDRRRAPEDHPRRRGADVPSSCGTSSRLGPSPQARGRRADRPRHRRHRHRAGPSPQARGRRDDRDRDRAGTRTIPAGAGPTWTGRNGPLWREDHPRRRGADIPSA